MTATSLPGGTFTMGEDFTVTRMGYGAMQLAGPHMFGPPADQDAAIAVLQKVVELGITHIDTSDYYGPYVTNQIIKEALHPYPDGLHIVTKVGARRDAQGGVSAAMAPDELRQAVHDKPRPSRARRAGRRQPSPHEIRKLRAAINRGTIHGAGRAPAGGSYQAPRPQPPAWRSISASQPAYLFLRARRRLSRSS